VGVGVREREGTSTTCTYVLSLCFIYNFTQHCKHNNEAPYVAPVVTWDDCALTHRGGVKRAVERRKESGEWRRGKEPHISCREQLWSPQRRSLLSASGCGVPAKKTNANY